MAHFDVKKRWLALSPRTRQVVAVVGLLAFLMGIGSILMGPTGAPIKRATQPSESNLLLPKPKDNSVESLAAKTEAQRVEIDKFKDALKQERADKDVILKRLEDVQGSSKGGSDPLLSDMMKEMTALKRQVEDLSTKAPAGPTPSLNDPLPVAGAASSPAPVVALDTSPKIRVIGDVKPAAKATKKDDVKPIAYLPSGSFFEAVLLNGMDAPTSSVAQKNPTPALMRVKTSALLPNNASSDITECFVLVSGFGVLSTERAQLRTESLSCVREGGKVLEAKLDGYVVGEDGRVGPRGRLVSKQGQMIAKSLAAGILNGFGQALTPSTVPQLSLNPTSSVTQTSQLGVGTVAETGVARGLSDASKAAASFYLDMAREMTPVVEIDANRKLTIVLIKGVELK